MKVVDLTRPLISGMPVFPGDPPVAIERVRTHDEDGFEVSRICLGSHSGTHLDAPRHFFPEGATLDEFPVGRFVGRGVIVDLRQTPPGGRKDRPPAPAGAALAPVAAPAESARVGSGGAEPAPAEGTPAVAGGAGPTAAGPALGLSPAVGPRPVLADATFLAERLRNCPLMPGDMALLWTEDAFLAEDAAQLLLDAGVVLVGTDSDSLDPRENAHGYGYPVHQLLLGHGILLAEGLCNLDQLGPGLVTCAFLPLAIAGVDGAPLRAVAWR
jgi:arylformamidase